MTKFIDFKQMFQEKNAKYPFIIANTDDSGKEGKHWWSILDIEPKKELFFFDSFDVEGLKSFIITDNKKTVQKIISGKEKMTRTYNKITLVKIKFSMKTCKNFSQK